MSSVSQEQIDYLRDARAGEYDQELEVAGRYAQRAAPEDPQGWGIDEEQSALEQHAIRGTEGMTR